MRAKEFWNAFSEKVMSTTSTRDELVKLWNNSKDFTDRMTEIISDIIKEYDKTLTVQPEYLRIDVPARKKNNGNGSVFCGEEKKFEKYDWNLEIAVEHENDYRLWMDEVIKLAHINCPLRVVIGYVHVKKDESGNNVSRDKTQKKQLKILNKVADILEDNVIAWNNINPLYPNDFMIILGDGNVKTDDSKCYYTPYLYDRKEKCFKEGTEYWAQRSNQNGRT